MSQHSNAKCAKCGQTGFTHYTNDTNGEGYWACDNVDCRDIHTENPALPPKTIKLAHEGSVPDFKAIDMGDVHILFKGIEHASRWGLEYEYVEAFLMEYKRSGDATMADWHGVCEWDL